MGEEESVKECTDHRAWNDASRSGCTERRSRVRNYGGRETTFPPAFPAFQRSNLPIFRGEATSRKIGARPANQQRFMQLRGSRVSENSFARFFALLSPTSSSPPDTAASKASTSLELSHDFEEEIIL